MAPAHDHDHAHCDHDHGPTHAHVAVAPFVRAAKVGRNDPCPCGSGHKYKKCCEGKPAS